VFKELLAGGEDHQLLSLLDHPSPWARFTAAMHCLDIDEERALSALTSLKEEESIVSISAENACMLWAEGDLRFRSK
jgi:hypothetical protein